MVLMGGVDLPTRAIREQIASALDLIVHLTRFRDGTRRVSQITEVEGMEGDIISLQDIFIFDYSAGVSDDGRFLGHARPTGLRPKFSTKLSDQGLPLPAGIFGTMDILSDGLARR
jgi:pilus assembly protein CpaF